MIADGVGYLAELYGTGVLAYVGGGFTSGVHNILEPAVLGLPVLFGPRTDNAWEASRLAALGAASTVTSPGLFALEAGRFLPAILGLALAAGIGADGLRGRRRAGGSRRRG